MKITKKSLFSLVLTLTMFFSLFSSSFSALAADKIIGTIVADTSNVGTVVNMGSLDQNAEFSVPINITENGGFCTLTLSLLYDESLSLVRVETGAMATVSEQGTTGKYSNEQNITNPVEVTGTGTFMTAIFKSSNNAVSGNHTISVYVNGNGETTDMDFDSVTFTTIAGTVQIVQATDIKSISINDGVTVYSDGTNYTIKNLTVTGTTYGGSTTSVNLEDCTTPEYKDGKVVVTLKSDPTIKAEKSVVAVAKAVESITLSQDTVSGKKVGSSLDSVIAGITLNAVYNDGSEEDNISLSKATITGYKADTTSEQTLTVTYGGKTAELKVTLEEKFVRKIAVKTNPTKTEYIQGMTADNVDLTGIVVTVTYDDDSTEDITDGITVKSIDSATVGTGTVTVSYSEYTATYPVTIVADYVERIEVTGTPVVYDNLDGTYTIDTSGITVTTVSAAGVTADTADYTPKYNSETGKVVITASGKTKEIACTPIKKAVSGIALNKNTVSGYKIGTELATILADVTMTVSYNNGDTDEGRSCY